ncbi:hypothetical protein EC988_001797 [Linderina pennispora]|nr:hypothetical protein EC988_001797 [Linderina pennispora]
MRGYTDDEHKPLLPTTTKRTGYCPPPAPLSPEDIIQRRRSLGLSSVYSASNHSQTSINYSSIEATACVDGQKHLWEKADSSEAWWFCCRGDHEMDGYRKCARCGVVTGE